MNVGQGAVLIVLIAISMLINIISSIWSGKAGWKQDLSILFTVIITIYVPASAFWILVQLGLI